MLNYSATVNLQKNLQIWALEMHRNSSRIAPVCPIQPTNSIQKQPRNLLDISSSTNIGVLLKWCQLASRLQQQEILLDKFCATEVSPFKSFPNVTLTQRQSSMMRLLYEKPVSRTQRIDRTA